MFTHTIDPILISLGPVEIRYYGLIFVFGFILTYLLLPIVAKARNIKIKRSDADDIIFYLMIGIIAGARLFYAFVYNLEQTLQDPLSIIAIWQGGLSFHGGLIGGIMAMLLYSRRKGIHFLDLADIIVIPSALALALGRIGNFINAELVGTITSLPWCVNFPGVDGCRHPSQLYESAKNLLIFSVLWSIKARKLARGVLFLSFVMMYSVLRFLIGFVRAPDPQIGYLAFGLTMGQYLNLIMFIASLTVLIYFQAHPQKKSA